ncbi:hypothetical protein QVD17_19483 [Tagetes erecta]|uniref:Uncharacterized protein n=1 Tax=Tagetes erecta TaxID=13708 RepID=A0AAD8KK09_TARER|nr:hypothetical protein QVD17_19483 [Tagetes erecta]
MDPIRSRHTRHRRRSHRRSPSPEQSRKHRKHEVDDKQRTAAIVSKFVDQIVKEKQQQKKSKESEKVEDDANG